MKIKSAVKVLVTIATPTLPLTIQRAMCVETQPSQRGLKEVS
jgi:hypothetical protein